MKYTIEIITPMGLIERVIECDYLSLKDPDRYNFMLKKTDYTCSECGTVHSTDINVGSYPRLSTILIRVE